MKEEKLILVTNDDGYDSKGLVAAVEVARAFGRVVVVAPETTQSGMSQAITMYNPLYLRCVRKEEGLEVYSFSGTPVDCVKMAFDYLLRDERVDLVISGINHGSNSAVNVLYSGTMGAAIEGSFYDCPSVGLSLDDHGADADFEAAVVYGKRIVRSVLEKKVELPLCLNVNVPVGKPGELHGIRLCRQNRGFWREEFYRHEDPRGVFLAHGRFRQRRARGGGYRRVGARARLCFDRAGAGRPDGLPPARSPCQCVGIILYL